MANVYGALEAAALLVAGAAFLYVRPGQELQTIRLAGALSSLLKVGCPRVVNGQPAVLVHHVERMRREVAILNSLPPAWPVEPEA